MPIYDYRCTACGREVEVVHGIHDTGPAACAVCGGAMRKALSPPAIHFRGAGWAKKDARAASAGASKVKETGGSTDSAPAESVPGERSSTAATADTPTPSAGPGSDKAAAAPKAATGPRTGAGSTSE